MCKTKSCDVNKFKAVTTFHDGLTCNRPSYWNCFHLGPIPPVPGQPTFTRGSRKWRTKQFNANCNITVFGLKLLVRVLCFVFCFLAFFIVSPNSSVILIPRETDLLWLKLICEEGKKFISQPFRWSIYWSFCANFRTQLGILKWMKLSWSPFLESPQTFSGPKS